MNARIVTTVDATIDPEREQELLEGFRRMNAGPTPEGLVTSELLRGQGGAWRLQTTWRDREALMAVRSSGEQPAALALLDRLGATHSHSVFTVEQSYGA
ncbi:antibiotic biosynthesis monooxygenase family protein [Kocuria dechangensis]|nr:antibiotic biosynthesis monooxygenase [Kocuria dechangensis]